ncbi:cellulase family glycosylhydrolase [Cellulomonas cellasea]|uniref:Aryl-phospho-beta-D-glucosidase BglC (GH1 family) n=1 Tax=Cellulomonas cellasea TaxID=43670 RepID=A0A7W4UGS0_9CELL|nr:cellulase family glycosylhydrolase [Cellulomonas cellasea]MBB2923283.1 aryl-phospho-beta-D-glucosidase BglC (GH1 family) [Cellulomonas cellasea]
MRRPAWTSLTALAAALALTTTVVAPASAGTAPQAGPRPAAVDPASEVVAEMQPGWNLGNTLDAVGADETAWGNPRVTEDLLRAVEDAGFQSVRIPVTLGQHSGPAPTWTIDPAVLDRVEEVVDQALDADLSVLLDLHHDSWMWTNQMPTRHDEVLAQFTATWEQLAERFRDHPRTLLFESINEPQFAGTSGDAQSYALLHELNVRFHEVVRSSGGRNADRVLVLPTLHTNADQGRLDALVATFEELDDPNLAATFHYYGYWPFSVNVAGGTRFDAAAQADLTGTFARVRETFVARGIPVILGEYGLLGFDRHTGTIEQGEKLKFFEALGHQARTTGVTTMLWDNGQHLSRTAFTWSDPALFAHLRSSWTRRSGTASTDQVFVRPGAVAAQTVTLNPNGQTVKGLYLDGKKLKAGTDFTLAGDALTLPAALLARLVGSGEHGTRAVLEVRFSKGLPWRVEIVSADTPVLSGATGTTDAFAVPTEFRGDRLATMEARYLDGTNAGPHSWTPFKEYDVTFAPDTAAGTIALRPTFFAEVIDGAPVVLTFHFWSGATVAYTVVRNGTAVTGTVG